jgi:hypothetical protein
VSARAGKAAARRDTSEVVRVGTGFRRRQPCDCWPPRRLLRSACVVQAARRRGRASTRTRSGGLVESRRMLESRRAFVVAKRRRGRSLCDVESRGASSQRDSPAFSTPH